MIYKVSNMSCKHCVMRISEELRKNGIKATIDLDSQSVEATSDKVPELLEKIGYHVVK
jgi:copper chaperone CopZ